MMLYALQYCFEDGSTHWSFMESKEERDFLFENYKGPHLVKRRDFKEVSDCED